MSGLYKIGVVSRKTGLSVATLRLWEDEYGLLTPQRSAGGTRLYSDSDVHRLLYIKSLVRERGYTLRAVADIIDDTRGDVPSAPDRAAIENLYLEAATNREKIEEGLRSAQVHALLRRVVRADSAGRAAVTLVEGVKLLTGSYSVALGLYRPQTHTLSFVTTLRGSELQQPPRPPLDVARLPRDWQDALQARVSYADPDLRRRELPGELSSRIKQDRTRSFHAEPLVVGSLLVGVLIIGYTQPGEVRREARLIAERVAVPAGPAIHYYAAGL